MTKEYSFIKPDYTLRNNLMAFGWEIGEGWVPLVTELFDEIEQLVKESPKKYENLEVLQVKEKWGGLRIYFCGETPEVEKLTEECADKCEKTCELCGKKGSMRERYRWYKTLCQECYNKWKL